MADGTYYNETSEFHRILHELPHKMKHVYPTVAEVRLIGNLERGSATIVRQFDDF